MGGIKDRAAAIVHGPLDAFLRRSYEGLLGDMKTSRTQTEVDFYTYSQLQY